MAKQHHAGFPTDADSDHLIHLSFNQDAGRFSIGTDRGFRIYNCDPFREVYRRYFDLPGGIGKVEMLFRSHMLALVSGRDNKVMIWDDHQSRCVAELSFRSEVRGVRLRRDLVAVALEHKIVLHNFADLIKMSQIETIDNPKGLFALSQAAGSLVLVCPGLHKGQLRVEHYLSIKRTKFIQAHNSSIASLTISQDGQWVATASTKGTIVRIFNTLDGTLLQELRRGMERADIFSLAFSQDCQWLAVSSCKGTVHVFGIKSESDRSETEVFSRSSSGGLMSSLSFVKGVLPKYFSSEWSVAQFRLPEGSHEYIVAFGQEKNTVVILGCDGSFYRCKFDPSTRGEMALMEHHNFLKPEDSF